MPEIILNIVENENLDSSHSKSKSDNQDEEYISLYVKSDTNICNLIDLEEEEEVEVEVEVEESNAVRKYSYNDTFHIPNDSSNKIVNLFHSKNSNEEYCTTMSHREKLFAICSSDSYEKMIKQKNKIEKLHESEHESLTHLNLNIFNEIFDKIFEIIDKFYFKNFISNVDLKNEIVNILISIIKDYNSENLLQLENVKKTTHRLSDTKKNKNLNSEVGREKRNTNYKLGQSSLEKKFLGINK